MSNTLNLKFTVNPINNITGEAQEDMSFGKVLDLSFDEIPLKSNKNYSLYHGILIDIRNARRKDEEHIEITKSDIESLKQILISATETNPKLNRRVSFLCEILDDTIAEDILLKKKEEEKTEPLVQPNISN